MAVCAWAVIRADTRIVPLERCENMKENWEILQNRIPLEEAVKRIYEAVKPLEETECDLEAADGTILSESYQAQYDQPPFPRSPLDGYALRGEETKGASREHPVVFPVVDQLCAGDRSNICVNPGQAVRIMTGAMIPEGANAVIRQEDTDLGEKQVSVWEEVKPYGNYCFQGEDYHAGDILVKEGTRLDYISIGILASGGKKRVKVRKIPRISLISFMVSSCYIKNPPFVSEKADFLYIKNTLSLSLPKTGFSMSAPFQITECRSVSAAAWLLLKSSRELLMFAVSYHEIHGSLVHLTDWIF